MKAEHEAAKKAVEALRIAAEEEAKKVAAAEKEALRIATEEAATKKAAEEEAKKIAAAEKEAIKIATEEAIRKTAEEKEELELIEQQKEYEKIKNTKRCIMATMGKDTDWESMSHTETGVKKAEIRKRSHVIQGFMVYQTKSITLSLTIQLPAFPPPVKLPFQPQPQSQKQNKQSHRRKMFNTGMMFGSRR